MWDNRGVSAASASAGRWLFGPVPDLFLGCGLGYAVVFLILALAGPWILAHQPGYVLPLLIMVASMPHYGATLLRVYEQRSERRAYAIFSVWATLVVFALFVAGVHWHGLASILLTVYLTWSPWHYTGQNYGIALVFLRRRGLDPPKPLKRWIYASFALSFVIVFFAMHTSVGAGYEVLSYQTGHVVFVSLGIPQGVSGVAIPLACVAYLLASGVAAVGLLRRLSLRDAVPAFTLALTQALWFSIPFVVRYFGWRTGIAPLDQSQVMRDYVLWIFVGHGVQYLWITSFYARRSQGAPGLPAYLGKAVIAGVALWTLPFVLFAPGFLGRLDFDMGMAALVASAVNIHHFILDGAIWKLRNLRIANVLIRSQVEAPTAPTPRAGWARPLVWTTATVGLAIGVFELFETRVAYPDALARGNLDRAALALDHLAWVGYERADLRARLGSAYARSGQIDAAAGQYEQSLALAPTARVWTALGQLDERRQRIGDARRAYERALAAGPDRPDGIHAGIARVARLQGDGAAAIGHLREALRLNPGAPAHANDLAWTLATTPDPRLREPDEAIRLARSVVEAGSPPGPNALDTLAAAYAAAGRFEEATDAALRALDLAASQGQTGLRDDIRTKLALYRQRQPFVDGPNGG
jgi:tetratricopeptide (TPR) repeat protein